MYILLPPSESKTRPTENDRGSLDLSAMSRPDLTAARQTMLRAAERTAKMRNGDALLGVPASAPELVERMARIGSEPVAPALEVYSGVLYEALGTPDVTADGWHVYVVSALLGIVDAMHDEIPAYRLSASSEVSRLGKAASWWKPKLAPLGASIMESAEVVVDCRSGAYKSMMPLSGAHVLEVSPVAEREGKRTVISHDAKKYRGLVARALLEAPQTADTANDVVEQLRAAFGDALGVELSEGRKTSTLTIVDRWREKT